MICRQLHKYKLLCTIKKSGISGFFYCAKFYIPSLEKSSCESFTMNPLAISTSFNAFFVSILGNGFFSPFFLAARFLIFSPSLPLFYSALNSTVFFNRLLSRQASRMRMVLSASSGLTINSLPSRITPNRFAKKSA